MSQRDVTHALSPDDLPLRAPPPRVEGKGAAVAPSERILLDVSASRRARGPWPWYYLVRFSVVPFYSVGRLILTDRRLIYRALRDVNTLFLTKPPMQLGDVELDVSRIVRIGRWGPLRWLSALTGYIGVEILLDDGACYRFGSLRRKLWSAAVDELARGHPNIRAALESS
jgi:hypothetical protein